MFKKISFIVFVTVCLVGGVWWLLYVKQIKTPVSPGINAIPSNAAFILESKQSKNVWQKLSQTNIMWEELLGTETFSKINTSARYLDSLTNLNTDVVNLLDNRSVFISAHVATNNSFDLLYVYSLPNVTHQSTVDEFLKTVNNKTAPIYTEYVGVKIGTIHPKEKPEFNFAFLDGTLMMSTKHSLVEDAIRQLKSGSPLAKDKYFSKVISTAGKNVDANIYINYNYFAKFLNRFSNKDSKSKTAGLANFADCSGWDITIKPNAVMLNGFTQANDSTNTFLNIFSRQKQKEIEVTKIIPSRTALLLWFGVSNIKNIHDDYWKYLKRKHLSEFSDTYLQEINSKYDVNIQHDMLNWITNEIALVVTEPNSADFSNNTYAVFHSTDISKAKASLTDLAKTICAADKQKLDTVSFRNHKITYLHLPGIYKNLLGGAFAAVRENYFTSIEKYIVFANTSESLKRIINDYENNKTLFNNKNYKTFSENISNQANVFLYSAISRSSDFYSSFLNDDLSKQIENKLALFKKFEGAAIQFTNNNHAFYSNMYLKYNPEQKQESGTLWEVKLDTTINSKPYLVINHNNKTKEVFVQDDANKIYLISNTGKIIWTKQLPEKIISEVVQVDVLKNGKLQMLFNTRSAIYLFDRNGNDMDGFPIKLKSGATNALTLVDYENKKDYRIFIATENKTIVCYKTNGELLKAFKNVQTTNKVFLPIQYFKAAGKDHLCAVDAKGKIYIIDRQGDTRVKMKEQLEAGVSNFFIETSKDYARTFIVTADTLGVVTKISLTNKKEIVKLNDFETSPYFNFQDLNNDDKNEFIFLTRNELNIFSSEKSLVYKYDFKDTLTLSPQTFVFADWTTYIGVTSEKNNKLYLFDDNGVLMDGFPKTGKTLFCVGDLNNDGTLNVVAGSADGSIYVYQVR